MMNALLIASVTVLLITSLILYWPRKDSKIQEPPKTPRGR